MEFFRTSLPLFIILSVILISFLPKTSAQFQFMGKKCGNVTYTLNSTYQTNVKAILKSLSSHTPVTYGYYNLSVGQGSDKIRAIALCRGDVPVNACHLCVQDSAATLQVDCPNQKQAFGYSKNCLIYFSNNLTFHVINYRPVLGLWNNKNFSSVIGYNRSLTSLLTNLQNKASIGNSELKYASGKANLTNTNKTIYGLVQCTPDLSRLDCVACVQSLFSFFPKWFVMPSFIAEGARITSPSCTARYEVFPFYDNVDEIPPPSSPQLLVPPTSNNNATSAQVEKSKNSHRSTIVIAITIVGLFILIISALLIFILLRRKKQRNSSAKSNKDEINAPHSLQFSLEAIKVATNDFSNDNKLGQGGFGVVYKGMLPDGQEIAVKRLGRNSVQGDVQFKNEILTLAKLQHRNLVRLLGFCFEDEEKILVYEFVINKSLDYFLFEPAQGASLPWELRYKIINGIARGLHYLHEDSRMRIIHRDLKAGNVVLDADFNPKIADFGMARLFGIDQTQAVASKIVGTYGYMAPEYVIHGQVSMKSDVFSFGVLVLEIVSGQRISSFKDGENPENLLTFAWKIWLEGTAWKLVDPTLSPAFRNEILRCIHIGLLCVQHTMVDRPTMSAVDLMLTSDSVSLQVPSQPAFFSRSHTPSNVPSEGNTSGQASSRLGAQSINEMSVTEVEPR